MSISTISPELTAPASRVAHSIASSIDRARRMLKPAGNSRSPGNGPWTIVRVPAANRRRTPSELARSPSALSSTPAFASAPTRARTRAHNSGSGIAPDSQCALVVCMIANLIA
jgi:hypothetical protein